MPKSNGQQADEAQTISGPRSYWAKLTPEQRSAEMRRRQRIAKRNKRERGLQPKRKYTKRQEVVPHDSYTAEEVLHEKQISYAQGKCEEWLRGYAERIGVSPQSFTFRVAELLRSSTVRAMAGTDERLPHQGMRRKAA